MSRITCLRGHHVK